MAETGPSRQDGGVWEVENQCCRARGRSVPWLCPHSCPPPPTPPPPAARLPRYPSFSLSLHLMVHSLFLFLFLGTGLQEHHAIVASERATFKESMSRMEAMYKAMQKQFETGVCVCVCMVGGKWEIVWESVL